MERIEVQEFTNPDLNLSAALEQDTGYSGMCWVKLNGNAQPNIDRDVSKPLQAFVAEVARIVRVNEMPGCQVGTAYMRVIDGTYPAKGMLWHVDNDSESGGVRFTTAISTDGAKVNTAWLTDDSLIGQEVEATSWEEVSYQPDNGVVVAFTTEPHGVLPQKARPGERTAIFSVTFYRSQNEADFSCRCTEDSESHPALYPALGT